MIVGQKKPHSSLAAESAAKSGENKSSTVGHEVYQSVRPISVSDGSTVGPDASTGAAAGGGAPVGVPAAGGGRATVDDYLGWLRAVDFRPAMFMTLTYDNRYSEMPAEWVRGTWKWLVHSLNREMAGPRYRKKFKHSYFSYVMALEYQKRGALHIHALIENPNEAVRYMRVHELWSPKFGGRYGFAWLSHVPNPRLMGLQALKAGSEDAALRYVLKYVLKDSSPLIWIKRKRIEVRSVDLRPHGAPVADPDAGGPVEFRYALVEAEVERLAQLELEGFDADCTG